MSRVIVFIFIFCNFFIVQKSYATHLIGGDFSYKCTGNSLYQFTLKIYRNCNSLSQGMFSNLAPISIYREISSTEYEFVRTVPVPLLSPIVSIPFPENPCLIPPDDVCVEVGTYIFEVELPIVEQSYHIVHQRCCRNGTISNIIAPGEIGTTYTIELTAAAQASCNNSPIFNDFPPIIICGNEDLVFDHSATDAEGDLLIYELCAPLKGGGLAGAQGNPGNPTDCDGFRPNPACPPPFDPVNYLTPTYTALEPMAGDPSVSIHPTTGVISGFPNALGQFVVGVCVKEYREGILLSVSQRDFQFNVEQCDPLIQVVIDADEVLGNEQFIINQCNDLTVVLNNQSFQEQFIDDFFWEFDINGTIQEFNNWDIILNLPSFGKYQGQLYLNPGTECGDTGYIEINIFPPILADFDINYDTCTVDSVLFIDQSIPGGGDLTDWRWNIADLDILESQNPSFQFEEAGFYPIQLSLLDINGCEASTTDTISWHPVPPLIIIEPSSFNDCPPAEIFFNNLSEPINEAYNINWDFGDSTSSDLISPFHEYEETGSYTIQVDIESPFGCTTSRTYHNWINITPTPIADFDFVPKALDNFNPTVQFSDSSLYNNSWYWNFDNESDSYFENPSYTFRDTGWQEVSLIVTHPNNCSDTIVQYIDIVPKARYFLPNAFTPNGDGTNDIFIGIGYLDGVRDFRMEIWNRWGERVFHTNDPFTGWNGTKNNYGKNAPSGVYICYVWFTEPRGEAAYFQEMISLIR